MKTDKIVWGLTLVFIGAILLLDNFNIIDFYWTSVWQFWPLVLILIGINMVFGRTKNNPWASTIIIALSCLLLGFITYFGIYKGTNSESRWSWSFDDEQEAKELSSGSFAEPMPESITYAELHIKGGATRYLLQDTTAQLFEADVKRSYGKFSLQKISSDSVEILNFNMKGKGEDIDLNDLEENRAGMKLNVQPIWRIFLEMGAGEADFDLSPYRVEKLEIKGGAASFSMKLGVPQQQTDVAVEAGMAAVKLSIPENVGCKINIQSGLSDKDFEGFEKQDDGTYLSPGYAQSAQKINIRLKGGLSDFEVKRY